MAQDHAGDRGGIHHFADVARHRREVVAASGVHNDALITIFDEVDVAAKRSQVGDAYPVDTVVGILV